MPSPRRLLAAATAVFVLAFLLVACAGKPKTDPFIEKWKAMAEQSRGHSPAERPREAVVASGPAERQPAILGGDTEQEVRSLPGQKVSLRMHNADILAVLQALARIAEQSIMISPNVEGTVSVNIVAMPWDQVFAGILRTNGLRWVWEGDIIRVLTLEDLEHELAMDDLERKRKATALESLQADPLYTSVFTVHYADAEDLAERLPLFLTKNAEGKPIGSVARDRHTNSLIVLATRSDIERVDLLLARLDAPSAQITLKAHIVETTSETARALGIQWGGSYARGPVGGGMNDSLFITDRKSVV